MNPTPDGSTSTLSAVRRLGVLGVVVGLGFVIVTCSAAAGPSLTFTRVVAPGGGVSDLVAGPGGMWFSVLGPKQLGRITPSGAVKAFTLPIVSIDSSAAGNNIVKGADGNVWLTGKTKTDSVLVRVTPSGNGRIVSLGIPLAPGKDAVAALGTGKRGPLSFGVWWNRVGRVSTAGALLAGAGGSTGFPQTAAALGFAADRSGAMRFVYGRGYGRISGTTVTAWEPTDGRKHEFRDIVLGPDGNMWVADNNNGERLGVGRITAAGKLTEFKVAGGPWSITAGPDGNLWVSLPYVGVARVTPAGKVTTYRGVGANPSAIASGFGKIWLVTDNAGVVARIDPPRN